MQIYIILAVKLLKLCKIYANFAGKLCMIYAIINAKLCKIYAEFTPKLCKINDNYVRLAANALNFCKIYAQA